MTTVVEKVINRAGVADLDPACSKFTFCPYTGDIFAIKQKTANYIKLFTRWFKFDIHVSIFRLRVISVISVCFTFSCFFCFFKHYPYHNLRLSC